MKTRKIGAGMFPDVAVDASGAPIVVYGNKGGVRIWRPRMPLVTLEDGYSHSFPRTDGEYAIYRGRDDAGRLVTLASGEMHPLPPCGGNYPVAIGLGFAAYQHGKRVWMVQLPMSERIDIRPSRPTGLSRIVPSPLAAPWVRYMDQDRKGGVMHGYADGIDVMENVDPIGVRCRLTDGRECFLWTGQDSRDPRVAALGGGRFAVVAWGEDVGVRLAVLEPSEFEAPGPAPLPPLPGPTHLILFGYFNVRSQYGFFGSEVEDYTNCDVLIAGSFLRPAPDYLDDVAGFRRAFKESIAARQAIILDVKAAVDRGLAIARDYWDRVDYLYLADEPEWDKGETERQIGDMHVKLDVMGLERKPILVNFTGGQIMTGTGWQADNLDVVCFEAFVDSSDQDASRIGAKLRAQIRAAKDRIGDRQMMIVIQGYDRNGAWTNLRSLEQIQTPPYREAYADPRVIGLLVFTYARKGGTRDHPELRPYHERIGHAILGG